jgi:hypothetical protein
MNSTKNEIVATFGEISRAAGLELETTNSSFVEIAGSGLVLRIRWEVERIKGVFVTLLRANTADESSFNEYGISYLVEFKNLPDIDNVDVARSKSNNVVAMAELVKRYALPYLLGEVTDFQAVEEYAKRRISENLPEVPNINASKWVRPEWLE